MRSLLLVAAILSINFLKSTFLCIFGGSLVIVKGHIGYFPRQNLLFVIKILVFNDLKVQKTCLSLSPVVVLFISFIRIVSTGLVLTENFILFPVKDLLIGLITFSRKVLLNIPL